MKYLFIVLALNPLMGFSQFVIEDNFESYDKTIGIHKQSPLWQLWDNGIEEQAAFVSDRKSFTGSKSLYFYSPHWAGGPSDIVLPIASYLEEGTVNIEFMMNVDTAAGAYFNIQGNEQLGKKYALHLSFDSDSILRISNHKIGNDRLKIGQFPKLEWFKLNISADLSENKWKIFIDNKLYHEFISPYNSISSLNFYPRSNNGKASYYIDDLKINYIPKPKLNLYADVVSASTEKYVLKSNYNKLKFLIINQGKESIQSMEFKFTRNDGIQYTRKYDKLNLQQDQKMNFLWDSIYVMDKEIINGNIELVTINDSPNFFSNSNKKDCNSKWIEPTEGKAILFEAMATSSCGYSPFLYSFIDEMRAKYGDLFIPVVNHHNDAMTVNYYQQYYLDYWSYYYFLTPYYMMNRTFNHYIGDTCEQVFLEKIGEPNTVKMDIGAMYDSTKKILNINFSTKFIAEEAYSSYMIFLTKNNIKVDNPAYDQVNTYSNLRSGKARGYENLPDLIPAKNMKYNHVLKFVLPSLFKGGEYKPENQLPIQLGEVINKLEKLPWPSSELDFENYDINIFFLSFKNQTVKRVNLADAIKRGLVINNADFNKTKEQISIVPNPVSDELSINYRSENNSLAKLQILDSKAAEVYTNNVQIHEGDNIIPIDVSHFLAGTYVLKISTETRTFSKVFVKIN